MFARVNISQAFLACVTGKTDYTVKNSRDFIQSVNEMVLEEDEVIVSFDVEALYTIIPIDRALLAIKDKLEDDDNWCERTTFSIIEIVELLNCVCGQHILHSKRGSTS